MVKTVFLVEICALEGSEWLEAFESKEEAEEFITEIRADQEFSEFLDDHNYFTTVIEISYYSNPNKKKLDSQMISACKEFFLGSKEESE